MTFEDDYVHLNFVTGTFDLPLSALGLEWPPPERITELAGVEMERPLVRIRMSEITDEQRAGMTHVARGAEYSYEEAE